jgi:HEPN domain-containing protein
MKPNASEEAARWLLQAEHVLGVATTLRNAGDYAETCFHAEQVGQLALKAYLYGRGERFVPIHSLRELLEHAMRYDAGFRQCEDAAKILDQYYIPTRYPDALAFPGVPYKTYTEGQAGEAVRLAQQILEAVKEKVGGSV